MFEIPKNDTLFPSQKAREWGVSETKIQEWIHRIHIIEHGLFYLFCAVKNITEEKFRVLFFEATEKEDMVLDIPCNFTQWWLSGNHPLALRAQVTLRELLVPHPYSAASDIPHHEIPYEISFPQFLHHHPEWANPDTSFIFFRDDPSIQNKPGVLIQRRQLSGNCYIHGPIVAHHYLLSKNVSVPVAIGIREFILCTLPSNLLAKLIVNYGGGSSREIFKMLLQPRSTLYSVTNFNEMCEKIRTIGPALLTGFAIEKRFRNDEIYYTGCYTTPIEGSHSMVGVGFRKDPATNEIFLLVQNWWQHKQFLVLDADYFGESGATALFPKYPVTCVPAFSSLTTAEYAEAGCDGDDLLPEEYRKS